MSSKSPFSRIASGSAISATEAAQGGLSFSGRFGYLIFASVLAPIFLLVAAWRTNSAKYRHWLLTAFVTIYGATITIQYDPGAAGGVDGVRHLALVYELYVGMTFDQFLRDMWSVLTLQLASDPGIRDPYKHLISFFSGGVLGQPQLFFTLVAFVYGYFFTGSLLEVFKYIHIRKMNYVILGFALVLFLHKNMEGINTVRTWTGMWVLVYAFLRYLDTRQKRYILLILTPPLIHFGFFLMILPVILVLLMGNKVKLYSIVFFISSFTTFFNPGDIVDVIENTERGASSVQWYLLEERQTLGERIDWAMGMETRWWNQFRFLGLQKWALNILIYTLLAAGVYFTMMNLRQKYFFSIGLAMLSLSNMTWFLYAVSNRTWVIGCFFVLAAFLMARTDPKTGPAITQRAPGYYKWGTQLSLLLFVPYLLFSMTTFMDFPSVFMMVAPFLVWIDPGMNMSIKYVLQVLLGIR